MMTDRGLSVSWREFAEEAPDLAAAVHGCFTVRKHCTLATLRKDGAPRISGTEIELSDGQLWIGSMPMARKALDLRRDPRMALHSPTVDPPEGAESSWAGEAKVAGIAVEVSRAEDGDGGHRFRIELTEAVHTTVDGDQLLIRSWHPGRGVEERRRA